MDEYMRDILKEKQEVADIIVDGALVTPEKQRSYFKEFVRRLSTDYNERFDIESVDEWYLLGYNFNQRVLCKNNQLQPTKLRSQRKL